jgi:hypothetical protein
MSADEGGGMNEAKKTVALELLRSRSVVRQNLFRRKAHLLQAIAGLVDHL